MRRIGILFLELLYLNQGNSEHKIYMKCRIFIP